MADLSDQTTQQLLRTIVHEETNDIRQTLDVLRQVQGSQSIMLRAVSTDVGQIKQTVREQGVFYEDLEDRFTALAEAVSENLTVRQQVQDHETRLYEVESTQTILTKTAQAHARKLKSH